MISKRVRFAINVIAFLERTTLRNSTLNRQQTPLRKMIKVKDCCCGLMSLKVGCIVIAVIYLIISVANWTWYLNAFGSSWDWLFILALILDILVGVALLLGVILDKFQLVLASAIGLLISIVLSVVIFIVMMANFTFGNTGYGTGNVVIGVSTGYVIGNVVFVALRIGLEIYFGIVILSYYQTMRRTRIF